MREIIATGAARSKRQSQSGCQNFGVDGAVRNASFVIVGSGYQTERSLRDVSHVGQAIAEHEQIAERSSGRRRREPPGEGSENLEMT